VLPSEEISLDAVNEFKPWRHSHVVFDWSVKRGFEPRNFVSLDARNSTWGKHRAIPADGGRIMHGGPHSHRLANNLPVIPSWSRAAEIFISASL
jgi:hypothetical protein